MNRKITALILSAALMAGCGVSDSNQGPLEIDRQFVTVQENGLGTIRVLSAARGWRRFVGIVLCRSAYFFGNRGMLRWQSGRFICRPPIAEEQSSESFRDRVFEFDAISGPTGISGGTDPRIQVNFIFKRSEGNFAPRTVMSGLSFTSQGSVVASRWRGGHAANSVHRR